MAAAARPVAAGPAAVADGPRDRVAAVRAAVHGGGRGGRLVRHRRAQACAGGAAIDEAAGDQADGLDLARELEAAYAQRDALAAVAAAAFARIVPDRLDALASWLQRLQEDDAALGELLNAVLDAAEPR